MMHSLRMQTVSSHVTLFVPQDFRQSTRAKILTIIQVDGKNAATGESSTFVNDLEPDSKKSSHSRDSNPGQPQGFNPNDGGVRTAGDGEQGGQYTDTKPIEQASESHSLPGPSSTGSGQKAKGHNPTQ